jgi:hypothetical protein
LKCCSTAIGFNWSTGKAAVVVVATIAVVERAARIVAVEAIVVVALREPVPERQMVLLEQGRAAAIVAVARVLPLLEWVAAARVEEAIAAPAAA